MVLQTIARLPLLRDALAALAGAAAATAWTRICVALTVRRVVGARKLLHLTTGPAFYMTLPLYSGAPTARFFAAAVPALFAVRLRRAARKESGDALGGAVAREKGNVAEAAGGPLSYAVAVAGLVLVAWRGAGGVMGMAMLAFGDGAADVVGSRVPVVSWPLPEGWGRKSVGGSLAFLGGGVGGAVAFSRLFAWGGFMEPVGVGVCAAVAVVAAAVELLPVEDNYSVPIAALIVTEALNIKFR